MFVIVSEGFIVVVDFRQMRVREYLREDREPSALLRRDLAVLLALPAAVPALLVLPIFGIADAGFGLDIVEPRVFHALPRGPHVLAGDRAGMAADTFIEVQHHRYLSADLHATVSLVA